MSLKWKTDKLAKTVLLFIDKEDSEVFLSEIRKVPPYNDEEKWVFIPVYSARELEIAESPDVLLFSRFLDQDNPGKILKTISQKFNDSHVVIVLGEMTSQAIQYEKKALEMGFENIVRGELPGKLPYSIFEALQYTYRECKDGVKRSSAGPANRSAESETRRGRRRRGYKVAVVGDKGGVGKTSVTARVAIALASGGIKVSGADVDFSRADLTKFFKLNSVPGIEQLRPGKIDEDTIEELLVPSEFYRDITLLPGPKNKLDFKSSDFNNDDIVKILEALAETAAITVVDTNSNYDCPQTPPILNCSDMVLVVIDQTGFSTTVSGGKNRDEEVDSGLVQYGEYLARHGVDPKKVRIVINNHSEKIERFAPVKKILKDMMEGMGSKEIKLGAVIPHDWDGYAISTHSGKISGIDEPGSPWLKLAEEIAMAAGEPYYLRTGSNNNGGFFRKLFRRKKH